MKDLKIVASYTFKEMVKRKSFLISNLIILLIIVIGFNVPNIIDRFQSGKEEGNKILIVDSENIFDGQLERLNQMGLGYLFEISTQSVSAEQIKEKMNANEIANAMVLRTEDGKIKLEYTVKELGMMSEVPQGCLEAMTSIYSNIQLSKMGLTQQQIESLVPNIELEMKQIENKEVKGNILVIMLLSIVLFYAIYFCAYQVSSSITTEKTSKIMETLVTSTTPRTIVVGKTIGIGLAGILQVSVMVAVAFICAVVFLPEGLLESVLDVSQITVKLGVITIAYFILGYTLYAFLYALTGSTVSKPEDIQSANSPIAILAVIGFYLAYFTMMNPTSELNVLASVFPLSSPFCMPFRMMMGVATTSEIILSLVIMLITSIIVAQVSIKIYSSAILNYGSRMKWKDMIKIYQEKNN